VLVAMSQDAQDGEQRMQYSNKLELLLTLVGYAVGLGNIWRFPYLAYSYGGGAFLIPYALSLLLLGLPLFMLELGLGQMFRQGTLGVWVKLGLARLRGVGAAATICTFLVSLYYNVILAWTIYYLGRTVGSSFSGTLPWDDEAEGFSCPESVLFPSVALASSGGAVDAATGTFNQAQRADFWCPQSGAPSAASEAPAGYVPVTVRPSSCPAIAAVRFWEEQALWQSSGLDDLGGFHGGMLLAYTAAWLLVYLCICKGIASSGKVVYVTATLPYVALVVFFFRAVTLPNAGRGVEFFLRPDFGLLLNGEVWLRAVTQIFYSLGVGFGSLIAFASYGKKDSDFILDAVKVSCINCGTSVFAGFVVFPILGFLAHELAEVNPCIAGDNLSDLSSIGLSGTGLAFIAFPIAISQMPGSFFWAILFFVMLLCLGIDSQFAMCESVVTVLRDAGVDRAIERRIGYSLPKPVFTAALCTISYLLGLVFVTRAGVYWFQLFDYYTCVVAMFFVTLLECFGLTWYNNATWQTFALRVKDWTGRHLGFPFLASWKYLCPLLLLLLLVLSFIKWDLMGAAESKPYPEGAGYLPGWSILLGWILGLLPVLGFVLMAVTPVKESMQADGDPRAAKGQGDAPEKAPNHEHAAGSNAADGSELHAAVVDPEDVIFTEPEGQVAVKDSNSVPGAGLASLRPMAQPSQLRCFGCMPW